MASDTGSRNAACSEYEVLLEDYLGGALDGGHARKVTEHLQACAGCSEAWDAAAAGTRLLRVALPSMDRAADPGPGFARMVMARIHAETLEQERATEGAGFWQPFVSLAWRFAATATLALALLLTYDATWGRRPQPNIESVRPTQVRDIFSPDPAIPPASRDEVLIMVADTNHGHH